ncbi:F-box/kelch-repeat protein At5g60570-like isoform X3 [Fagus crenata]
MEGAGCESPVTVGVQGCGMSQLPKSYDQDFGFLRQNLHLLAHSLLAKNNGLKAKDFKCLLDKERHNPNLDCTVLKNKKPMVIARSGENHEGQASDDSFLPGLTDDVALDVLAWSSRSGYPNLASLNKKFKSLIDSGYLYSLRRRLGVVEHWIYLACILMPWEAFDPVKERWMRLPRMPCDDCFTYADKESLAVGTKLLVFGRELTGFAIWMYSLLSRDWSRCPLMDLPRCLFGSSSLGEVAIVAGGSDKNGRVLKSAELFNSELGTWQTLKEMGVPRKLCSGFFMDGKFYVIGGMSSHTDRLTCGEEYNMETGTWRRIENMYPISDVGREPAMCSPPLVAVVNNQLYSADQATNEVKKYDKVNNSWAIVKRLPVRADSSNGWGLAFKACGNSLLVIGGHRGPEGEVIVLHSWEPKDANQDWRVLSVRERAGAFVYNCAVMGC